MRLLVVDDDRFFRELLTSMLERHGHTVTAVPSAGDALAYFQPGRFDAVLAAIGHVAFLRAFPLWSLITIGLCVLLVHALTAPPRGARGA